MKRLVLFPLLAAACSAPAHAPARAPVTNTATVSRYTLQPFELGPIEGRHSAVHSRTHTSGALTLEGPRATLELVHTSDISFVHCPAEFRDPHVHTVQQCADDSQKDYTRTSRRLLRGDAAWRAGKLVANLRGDHLSFVLACDETPTGLTCKLDEMPEVYVFAIARS